MAGKLLDGPPDRGPEAVVIVVAEGDAAEKAREFSRRWQSAVPRAVFLGLEIQGELARSNGGRFARRFARIAKHLSLSPSHTIVLGEGAAGRVALDLVLQRRIVAAGVLAIDIPVRPLPTRRRQIRPVVRLIQCRSADDPESEGLIAFLKELRFAAFDLRYALLPSAAALTPDVMVRAGASYLVELVAIASRFSSEEGGAS